MTGPRRVDVLIAGDGPAGAALAQACRATGLDVVVVGPGAPWTNTYAAWVDELPGLPADVWATRRDSVVVRGESSHRIARTYGVLDGARLADHLLDGVSHVAGRVVGVERTVESVEVVVQRADGASRLAARLVVDASGATPVLARLGSARTVASYQTAYGAVVDAPPTGYDVDTVALMDFRPPGDDTRSTFCYVVPVADGWLVEETSLAARPAVDLAVLEARLQRRVGADLVASATRVERVSITMGLPLPSRAQHVVAFGAAASYVHPATGYSITASLRAAPRVAAAIAQAPIGAPVDPRPVWNAVWPAEQRRVRALHDYGLAALLRLQPGGVREFFDAFFSLPVERWSPYLRIDATVAEVVAVMRAVFNSVSWPVRRRLAAGNPVALARSLR